MNNKVNLEMWHENRNNVHAQGRAAERMQVPGIANLRIGSIRVSPHKMSEQKPLQTTAIDPTQCQIGVWRSRVQ